METSCTMVVNSFTLRPGRIKTKGMKVKIGKGFLQKFLSSLSF